MDAERTTKTAMLSGSTGGIGSEIAKLLAQRCWNLALVNRSADKAQEQAAQLRRDYPNVSVCIYMADLLDQLEIVSVCKEISRAHPKLDADETDSCFSWWNGRCSSGSGVSRPPSSHRCGVWRDAPQGRHEIVHGMFRCTGGRLQ